MRPETLDIARACMRRDLERLARRAGSCCPGGASHAARLDAIVSLADRIAFGGSVPTAEACGDAPLMSVFSHMNGCSRPMAVTLFSKRGVIPLPVPPERARLTSADYARLWKELSSGLLALPDDEAWFSARLDLLETCLARVPAGGRDEDISLFDHLKLSAAAGCCVGEYLAAQGGGGGTSPCTDDSLWNVPAFLLYSADFSGTQSFIYTIATRQAVRSLRSRSFFLELAMECFIDELLSACGLQRTNLLYSGGGHCYLLLPNTGAVKAAVREVSDCFNGWLRDAFGTRLFLADGWTACSAGELTNLYAAGDPAATIFARVSREIAARKLHRYTADQIRALNSETPDPAGRECKICGRADHLTGDGLCAWCRRFAELSVKIQQQDIYVVSDREAGSDFSFPSPTGKVYLSLTDERSARARLDAGEPIRRIYAKNRRVSLPGAIRLFVGDYAFSNNVEELAEDGRLAVCRMDVDNLGTAFTAGFVQPDSRDPYRYASLSRTAGFSRQMSVFFKYYINMLLEGLKTSIVYSGGDDVFLIGALEDTLSAALRIRTALRAFSCETLTISGGLGLFDMRYPLRRAAEDAADLEDCAKSVPGKDALALFDADGSLTYHWDDFIANVQESKLREIADFFDASKAVAAYGNSFLYNLLDLLRGCGERINLARYAYLLSRMEPARNDPLYSRYKAFSKSMLGWARDSESRRQLITAIYLYVYHCRRER